MTVSELIEELQKFPGHHPVVIEYPGEPNYETGGMGFELGSIDGATERVIFSHHQPTVVISALGWCK
ncbi:hypothetical protein ABH944_004810 [Caballeronia udeis]|uniref:Uncharacterized protein n=1 Tax=Caballeronia udeis TaxID=1232866 RepID=A0ABW8MQH6_9BURK